MVRVLIVMRGSKEWGGNFRPFFFVDATSFDGRGTCPVERRARHLDKSGGGRRRDIRNNGSSWMAVSFAGFD